MMPHEASSNSGAQTTITVLGPNETPRRNNDLHMAARLKKINDVREIIEIEASRIYHRNSKGDTPLHLAARVGCVEVATLLITKGTSPNQLVMITNYRNDTALHDAVRNAHFKIVKLLIEQNQDLVGVENCNRESALYLSVDRKYLDIARHILQYDNCSFNGKNGQNVLHALVIRTQLVDPALKNHYPIWKLYLLSMTTMSEEQIRRKVFENVYRSATEFTRMILEKSPSASNKADEYGWTPLHYAAKLDLVEIVDLLVEKDKSVAYDTNNDGMYAIHIAASEGHVYVVEKLVEKCEVSTELLDRNHGTALHCATKRGKYSFVLHILKNMPSFEGLLNEQDIDGNTPLLLAAVHGHEKLVSLFANDGRIDKAVVNNEGFAATDIIQSHPEITFASKESLAKALEGTSSSLSLVNQFDASKEGFKEETRRDTRGEGPDRNNGVARSNRNETPGINKTTQLREYEDVTVVVAILVATVTFSAGFTMPGGYESNGDHKGMALLSNTWSFYIFFISDTIAFLFSTTAVIILWLPNRIARGFPQTVNLAKTFTLFSVLTMVTAFITGTAVVLGKSPALRYIPALMFYGFLILLLLTITSRNISRELRYFSGEKGDLMNMFTFQQQIVEMLAGFCIHQSIVSIMITWCFKFIKNMILRYVWINRD